jgi:23S rRNA pseudouridine1911/1915/1917 synthase
MHYHKEKNHLVIEIDERIQGMTLLEFFHYLHLSKKTIHLLRQNKDYTLNNTYVDYQTILKDKDILSIKAYETGRDFIEQESSLEIIYEDDLLCIVNKPSNLIIHPDDKSKKNTLCNYVSYYYQQSYQDLPIRYLHRLDRDTTGLVMFCKCALLQPYFDYMIASKKIKKTYLAIIQGHLPKREMTIDLPIGQDRHSKNKMCISKTGKDALTHFKEIKTKGNYTLSN